MSLLVVIIILALVFDYINGFHDAANSIATVVSTKVLTPFQAVLWAAFFNFVAFFIFKDHAVANTIGKTVLPEFITLPVILSGLIAAIAWNLLTWWYGIPSSSSHTLIGGFAGAAIAHAFSTKGLMSLANVVELSKILQIIFFIFLAPLIGMAISMFITVVTVYKNLWIRYAVIVAATLFTWFLFNKFEQNKIKDNLTKFYKVDKYKKEAEKDSSKTAKYESAKANLDQSLVFAKAYNEIGADSIAKQIVKADLLGDITISAVKDSVKATIGFKQYEIAARNDKTKKQALDSITGIVDGGKELYKQYGKVNNAQLTDSISAFLQLNSDQKAGLNNRLADINMEKSVAKAIAKADNSFIFNCILGVVIIFMLTFFYVEKIKEPNAYRLSNMFKKLQLLSSAAFSVGHGGNDAQKVMGIIAAALVADGRIGDIRDMPTWVPLACYMAIGLGTMSGGWKIVKTMGTRITKVTPLEGVAAETSGAMTLFMTEQMGIPVSTTHTITGSIIGVGATKRLSAVRWGVTINLLWAWILTIPVSAILAALVYFLTRAIL